MAKAYHEGATAAREGKMPKDNPYQKLTPDHALWKTGHKDNRPYKPPKIKESVLAAAEKDFSTFRDIIGSAVEEKFAGTLRDYVMEKRLVAGIHITYLDGKETKKMFLPHHEAKLHHKDAHTGAAREYIRKMMPGSNMKRVVQVTRGFQTL